MMMKSSTACTALAAAFLSAIAPSAMAAPTDLHLRYAIYVHGFRAIELDAALRIDGHAYDVETEDHTTGFVGAFVSSHVASHADGTIVDGRAHPTRFASAGFSRGANRRTVIDYPDGNPVVRILSPVEEKRDKVPASDTIGSVDTLSAVAALLEQAASTGRCDSTTTVFDGARLSVVRVVTAGTQPVPKSDRSPYDGSALRCDVTSQETGGFLNDENLAASHRPQTGAVWLATVVPNARPVPIRGSFTTVDHGPVSIYLLSAS